MPTDLRSQDWTLATDLDGTLIPLDGLPQNVADLAELGHQLEAHGIPLVFVSGRHLESIEYAIATWQLPQPDYIIGDVGTSIFARSPANRYQLMQHYLDHLARIVGEWPLERLRGQLGEVSGARLQEPEKQGRFKLSFYAAADGLEPIVGRLQQRLEQLGAPYSLVSSVDPFNGAGLIDLLPQGVSKAYALDWWTADTGRDRSRVVFAGDSGNDSAVFAAGYRCIIVSNAADDVVQDAEAAHAAAGWTDRLYRAERPGTSGLLEGCRWYRLF